MLQEAIKSPYVSYEYYQQTFSGKTITEEEFSRLEFQAEAFLDRITFGRVKGLPEIPEAVKMAICAMAEYSCQEGKKTPGVRSENIDGYSVSYGDTGSSGKSRSEELYQIASNYLMSTGLLFRGGVKRHDCKCGHHRF